MSNVNDNNFFRELGAKGLQASHAARKRNTKRRKEACEVSRAILSTKFTPVEGLKNALNSIGIDTTKELTIMSGIISVFAGKALSGDLKAARFILDLAGYSLNAKEQIARIKSLEKMVNAEIIDSQPTEESVSIDDIRAEANKLGIYGGDDVKN